MKIVIAEDDDVPRLILRRVLRSFDYEVAEFSSGLDAWEFLRAGETRILITDWMMPGLDGLELCRKLRERDGQEPYVYAILLTARTSRVDRLKALEAGADDLLAKPLDRAELFARLKVARRIISMEEQLRNRSNELERMHSELERRNIQLADMASCDGLTGLRNHRYFRESLEAQYILARRNTSPLSVMMLDVDAFKAYNDAFGHPAGDEILRELGQILRANLRSRDILARYGGEEFAALLPSTDVELSRQIGQRLRKAVEDHPWPRRAITISLGIATTLSAPNRASHLLELADRSLYQSKAEGRNRITHAEDLPEDVADRRRLEQDLRQLDSSRLSLVEPR